MIPADLLLKIIISIVVALLAIKAIGVWFIYAEVRKMRQGIDQIAGDTIVALSEIEDALK
jgi:hypothetical protein